MAIVVWARRRPASGFDPALELSHHVASRT